MLRPFDQMIMSLAKLTPKDKCISNVDLHLKMYQANPSAANEAMLLSNMHILIHRLMIDGMGEERAQREIEIVSHGVDMMKNVKHN